MGFFKGFRETSGLPSALGKPATKGKRSLLRVGSRVREIVCVFPMTHFGSSGFWILLGKSPQLKGRTLVSSDKYMFRLVDGQYSEFEEFHVPKPVCLALHGFDFVVHPLQWAC